MRKYQIIIRNDEKTGNINYRKILKEDKIKLFPKKDNDGLSIFIITEIEQIKLLKIKYNWILTILPTSSSIKINYPPKNRRNREYRQPNLK